MYQSACLRIPRIRRTCLCVPNILSTCLGVLRIRACVCGRRRRPGRHLPEGWHPGARFFFLMFNMIAKITVALRYLSMPLFFLAGLSSFIPANVVKGSPSLASSYSLPSSSWSSSLSSSLSSSPSSSSSDNCVPAPSCPTPHNPHRIPQVNGAFFSKTL